MQYEILKDKYTSPRITGEFTDCSMPMTFDQYNNCGYNCLYCFSTFQRAIGQSAENYLKKAVKKVGIKKFKSYFENPDDPKNPFGGLIKNRITMQWGGLSDPFCPIEEQEGLGYEILSYLKEIRYPVNFSSKSDLLLRNKDYLQLFEGMGDVWSYKASIITWNPDTARILEAGAPSPQRRAEVLKTLSSMGIWTIWRLRPFIIGITDKDYEEQLKVAKEYGVKAISTEFFCLELRSINTAKSKYDQMSKLCGFDIVQFYKNVSTTTGYLRLNRTIKEPYYKRMRELCDKYGINMHVSDAQGKEYSDSGSCCGLPDDKEGNPALTKYSGFQFTNALKICRQKGEVSWDDISKNDVWMKGLHTQKAPGLNTGNNYKRQRYCDMDMYTYLRNLWNSPKQANSPYRYFGGIMKPDRLDKNKNIIYKYNPYKEKNNKCASCQGNCHG